MSETVIKVEQVSKQYRLGKIGTGTFTHDLNRWWHTVRGKEDPYLKIGEVNDRSKKGSSEYVWALQDISFDVKQGDVLGIIGKNGAGKSTLLKILSRTTLPTTGSIKIKGRVASLLEVGTGFHPELTGRENVFLNGAILGMTKSEIRSKFDEIVDFSGVEKYIDTPVKRYSSGMYVRLAFAVAAHLEPEILIVDEVLAVGDAEFQKKALGKMQDVSKGQGRTVLFVSHNMAAVKSLCRSGLLLENGKMSAFGSIDYIMGKYMEIGLSNLTTIEWNEDAPGNDNIRLKHCKVYATTGNELNIESGITVEVSFLNFKKDINLSIGIFFHTMDDILLFEAGHIISDQQNSKTGNYIIKAQIPAYLLNTGSYKLNLIFGENQKYVLFSYKERISFELSETLFDRGKNLGKVNGLLRPRCLFEERFVNEII